MKRKVSSKPTDTLLEGSVAKGLIWFAFPLFLGNLFQQLYNTADTLIVGNFLPKESLAAVSSSGNLIFMLVGFLNGIAGGAGVVIAKYFGAKDEESLSRAVHTNVAFGLAGGGLLTVVGVLLTPQILTWMGTPPDVLPESITYFQVYFFGVMATFLYSIGAGILQAVGDSRHPLYYLIVSSVINILLDLLFVGGFGWGVASAAAATVISQAVSAVLCLYRLLRLEKVCRVEIKKIRFHGDMFSQIIRFGLPAGVQNSVIGFANVMVQTQINLFDADAVAGCGSYSKVEGFVFLPVTCFAMGLATFVSQNLGAGQLERVRKGTRFGILCSVTLTEGIGVLIWLFAPFVIGLFNQDPAVIDYGTRQARTEAFFYFLMAFSHCVAGVMRGAGRAYVPMLVMLGCWCVVRVSYILLAMQAFQDILVVFTAYPLTWFLSSVFFLIYYLKADWIHSFEKQGKHHPKEIQP